MAPVERLTAGEKMDTKGTEGAKWTVLSRRREVGWVGGMKKKKQERLAASSRGSGNVA
jgi:hypothetical protein